MNYTGLVFFLCTLSFLYVFIKFLDPQGYKNVDKKENQHLIARKNTEIPEQWWAHFQLRIHSQI